MIINENTNLNSPVRQIKAKVELYNGSTLVNTFTYTDALRELTIERVGEGKFFGFGICQKLNLKLIDKNRELDITTANSIKVYFSTGADYINAFPVFKVSQTNRDEVTNELSITAYDALYAAANEHTTAEITLESYTIREYAAACASILGLGLAIEGGADAAFTTYYENGANFGGEESMREALNDVAEATQTIYYINGSTLVFKRLDKDGEAVAQITKADYFELDNKENRRLQSIVRATELGDDIEASATAIGSTQYVRDNAFWEMREDIDKLLEAAIIAAGGLSINQFTCSWRGNYLIEIGDKIELVTKDDQNFISFLLDDVITYNGALAQNTQWSYEDSEKTAANAATLGEALKQTFARVDKQKQEIELHASKIGANDASISTLLLNTDSISASVTSVETKLDNEINNINSSLTTLTNSVEAKLTDENLSIVVSKELAKGISANKVVTTNSYTFDETGLNIAKSGTEISTRISENGMTVSKNNDEVLVANDAGVKAQDLHATTYLIIGTRSRFEDYDAFGVPRTGCFWIGG